MRKVWTCGYCGSRGRKAEMIECHGGQEELGYECPCGKLYSSEQLAVRCYAYHRKEAKP